jgi:ABC-type transport system involved in multi-copper enzyme maturation permease subunit
MEQYAEAEDAQRDTARASGKVWQFMATGVATEKKPGSLAVLGHGLESEMTRSLSYSGWNEVEVGPPKVFSPLFKIYTPPDFIYIINVIGSLLALLFVYDAICGEKEQGTLRLALTYALPRDYILLAKWAGGVISLCLPLTLTSLGVVIYLCFIPSFEMTLDIGIRFLLVFLVSLLYLSSFFTLGLLVSCLTRRSTTSLMICLFLWIILVLTIPNLAPMMARRMMPIPSEGKMAIEKMHRAQEVREWAGSTIRAEIHDQDEYHETVERLVARALEGINQFRRNRVQDQMTLAMNMSRISPSACYLFAASDLAKTGLGAFTRFQRYVIWYRQLFNQAKDRIIAAARERSKGKGWWGGADLLPEDLKHIPAFRPLEIPFTDSLKFAGFDIAVLITYNVVLFLAAYAAFLKYDVR